MEKTKLKAKIESVYGTQRDFAKACGVSEASVSRFIAGSRSWRGETVIKAAKLLGVNGDDIDAYFFPHLFAKEAKHEG